MILIGYGAVVCGMLRLGRSGLSVPRVRCGWRMGVVLYERDVMSLVRCASCMRRLFVTRVGWMGMYDLFLQKNEEREGGLLLCTTGLQSWATTAAHPIKCEV